MAIGTPVEIARNNTTGTASLTLVLTLGTAVSAGDLIIVVAVNHNTASVVATDVSDSGGANAYTLITVPNASACSGLLAYQGNAAALSIGATITVTYPSTRNIAAVAYKVSGASSSPFDVQATVAQASATALSVGPTGATAQANELVMACFTWSGTHTITATNGYTAGTKAECTTTIRGVCAEWKIVSATGTQTATGTLNTASVSADIVATFKEASGSTFNEAGEGDLITVASGADAETMADAGQAATIGVASGADTTTIADAGQATSQRTGSGADAVTFTEAGQASSTRTGSGADAQTFVDAGGGAVVTVASGADAANWTDAGQATSLASASGVDTIAFTEAAAALMGLTASGADSFNSGGVTYDDAGGALMGLGSSGADAITFTEAATALMALDGSGADTFSGGGGTIYTDAGGAVAGLFGFGADVITMVDAGGGVLIARGSGSAPTPAPPITTATQAPDYIYDIASATGSVHGGTPVMGPSPQQTSVINDPIVLDTVRKSPTGSVTGGTIQRSESNYG